MQEISENERQRIKTREYTRRSREKQKKLLNQLQARVDELEKIIQCHQKPKYIHLMRRFEALVRQNEYFRIEILRYHTFYLNILHEIPTFPLIQLDSRLYDISYLYSLIWKHIIELEMIDLSNRNCKFDLFGWKLYTDFKIKKNHIVYEIYKPLKNIPAEIAMSLYWHMLTTSQLFLSISNIFKRHSIIHSINDSLAVICIELTLPTCSKEFYLVSFRYNGSLYYMGMKRDLSEYYTVSMIKFSQLENGHIHHSSGFHAFQTDSHEREASELMQMHLFIQRQWELHLYQVFEPKVVDEHG